MPAVQQAPESERRPQSKWTPFKAALYSRASRDYRAPRHGRAVPTQKRGERRSALGYMLLALFPYENTTDYPGVVAGSIRLFEHRVTGWAIAKWKIGKRRTPLWALATAAQAGRRQAESLIHAAELCEAEIKKRRESGA